MTNKFKCITAILLFGATCLHAGGYTGNASINVGNKILDSAQNDGNLDLNSQFQWGLEADVTKEGWPISIYVGNLKGSSSDPVEDQEGLDLGATTNELRLGIRKYFMPRSKFNLLLGAGIANITAKRIFELETADFFVGADSIVWEENVTGYYAEAGVNYMITQRYSAGLNMSYSTAKEVELVSLSSLSEDPYNEKYNPGGLSINAKMSVAFSL